MAFELPPYYAPDFTRETLRNAPDVRWAPAPKDGVAPEYYHSTSMYPEYFKVDGVWKLAEESRMDSSVVMGPAFSFDYDARRAMQALVDNGYAHGLLAGNALATHDLEGALLNTALGQDIYTQKSMPSSSTDRQSSTGITMETR